MTIPLRPNGERELIARFGDPRRYVLPDGTLAPVWEKNNIVRIDLPAPLRLDFLPHDDEPMVSKITANRLIAPLLLETLEIVHEQSLWEQLGGYSGGFAWRPQRGNTRKLSLHAWGLAWDFGASRDPLGDKPGGPDPDMPQEIVNIFTAYGFVWGGEWSRADQMHFQYCTNY